jgi:hypothetical protein
MHGMEEAAIEPAARSFWRERSNSVELSNAVRNNLATLLAEASELGHGLPRYVEQDFSK